MKYLRWNLMRLFKALLRLLGTYPVMLVCWLPMMLYLGANELNGRMESWW